MTQLYKLFCHIADLVGDHLHHRLLRQPHLSHPIWGFDFIRPTEIWSADRWKILTIWRGLTKRPLWFYRTSYVCHKIVPMHQKHYISSPSSRVGHHHGREMLIDICLFYDLGKTSRGGPCRLQGIPHSDTLWAYFIGFEIYRYRYGINSILCLIFLNSQF